MITLGTGIGGGIVIDRKIYSGLGDAGEIGHMCIQADGILCPCGQRGCWEKYASVSALVEQMQAAAKENKDSLLYQMIQENHEMVDGKLIFSAIKQGCEVAKAVFDKYLDWLTVGIRNVIMIFRPETVVLAGGITTEKELLLKPLIERVASDVPIKISKLQSDAGVVGAALLARD